MKLPLRPTFLLKIPYFDILFSTRFEGFSEDFATYYNHILETNPEENLKVFQEFSQSQTDFEKKIIIHNLGVYYFRYQKKYWAKRPQNSFKFLHWEKIFETFLPTYNATYDANILIGPKWDKLTENYSKFIITEPDGHQYLIRGLEMLFLEEIVPHVLLPAFTLAILIVYYEYKSELEDFLQIEDPTYKII